MVGVEGRQNSKRRHSVSAQTRFAGNYGQLRTAHWLHLAILQPDKGRQLQVVQMLFILSAASVLLVLVGVMLL